MSAFDRAQARYDNAAPPEDELSGWTECHECHGDGCDHCDFEGGSSQGQAMSNYEFNRRQRRAREELHTD